MRTRTMARLLRALLLAAPFGAAVALAAPAGAAPCGDQNGDGVLNVKDIVAINDAVEGRQAAGNCDATGDGLCDAADVAAVRDSILGRCTPVCAAAPSPRPEQPPACPASAPD